MNGKHDGRTDHKKASSRISIVTKYTIIIWIYCILQFRGCCLYSMWSRGSLQTVSGMKPPSCLFFDKNRKCLFFTKKRRGLFFAKNRRYLFIVNNRRYSSFAKNRSCLLLSRNRRCLFYVKNIRCLSLPRADVYLCH